MKKINLALAATLALACSLFSSCKEEDDLRVTNALLYRLS